MTHKPLMDIQTGKYLLHPEGLASGYYDLCRVPNGDLTQTPEKVFSRILNETWSIATPFVDINTEYDLSYPLRRLIKGQATGCHIVHPEGIDPLPFDDCTLDQAIRDTHRFVVERLCQDLAHYQYESVGFTFTNADKEADSWMFTDALLEGQITYGEIRHPITIAFAHPDNPQSFVSSYLTIRFHTLEDYTAMWRMPGSSLYPSEFDHFVTDGCPPYYYMYKPENGYLYSRPLTKVKYWFDYDEILSDIKAHLTDIAVTLIKYYEPDPEWSTEALKTKKRVEEFLGALYVKTASGWTYHPGLKTFFATFRTTGLDLTPPSLTFHIDAQTGRVCHVGVGLSLRHRFRQDLEDQYLQVKQGDFLPLSWIWHNPENPAFAAYFGHDVKRFPSRKQLQAYIQQAYDDTAELRKNAGGSNE